MRKKSPSIDGFIPRRASGERDQSSGGESGLQSSFADSNLTHASDDREAKGSSLQPEQASALSRSSIDATLQGIDSEEEHEKRSRKKHLNKRKLIKRVGLTLLLLVIAAMVFLGIKFLIAGGNIFQGNILGLVQSKSLKADANGRSNVLVFGTSEDDPGHAAPYLTDSIMVLSVDQVKKDAYMISIPRDLWVEYGRACNAGFEGKINEVYGCFGDAGNDEKAGADALREKVGQVLGLDVQYYAHVNYSVVRDTVKALDGVELVIESRDPNGQMDSNFDWKCKGGNEYASRATMIENCPPNGHFIDYPNGPVKLDAEHALYLAQARGDSAPTYGFEQSNFDRERNQQKIVKAIREKALSAGTLTNFGKVSNLMSAIGDNLRTDFEMSEIRTIVGLAQDIPDDKIISIDLFTSDNPVVKGANFSGAVVPIAGTFEYSGIRAFVKKAISSDPAVREEATIGIYNGSVASGVAQKTADELDAKGFGVSDVGNAPDGKYAAYEVYDLTGDNGKPNTRAKLESLYGTKAKTIAPPFATTGLDFVIIIGDAAQNTP